MYVSDAVFLALMLGGLVGIVLHPDTRVLTGLVAFGLFLVNLYTDLGGGFSIRVFFATAALMAGFLLWELLRLGRGILLWGKQHTDALLSRAEPLDRQPAQSTHSDGPEPTDGLWYLWRDREDDDP